MNWQFYQQSDKRRIINYKTNTQLNAFNKTNQEKHIQLILIEAFLLIILRNWQKAFLLIILRNWQKS